MNQTPATREDLRELEYRLTLRLGGITVACASLLLAAIALFK